MNAISKIPSESGMLQLAEMPNVSQKQAQILVARASKISGVKSGAEKPEFIRARLAPRLKALNCETFDRYIALIDGPNGAAELPHLVEALTTHTTSFFRENAHFEWLHKTGLPERAAAGAGLNRELTVWSCAVSTGAELWSAGMVVEEFRRTTQSSLRYRLIGTDISTRILRQAAAATFNKSEIEGIPENLRRSYLLRSRNNGGASETFRIVPDLRRRAQLSFANLMDLGRASAFRADVAFLRNVLIYFDRDVQENVVKSVVSRLHPGGYLLVAHTESLRVLPNGLRQVGRSIYQKDF